MTRALPRWLTLAICSNRLLKLSDNAIRNLLELGRLEALEQLWLDNNDIIDAIPVLVEQRLCALNLQGNPRLQCPPSGTISPTLQLTPPGALHRTMIYWLWAALAMLPLPIKYGLAWLAAVFLQRVFRYRAKVIDTNLQNAFLSGMRHGEPTLPHGFTGSSPMSPWKSSMPPACRSASSSSV